MVGTMVAHYRILSELGAGGMGVVYLAEDTRLGRRVAIKFLPEAANRNATARQRFMAEARAASSLDHPNVCAIHQVDETPDGRVFMVMGYYEGETLDRTVARGPLGARRVLELTAQLADGLAAAHARGIVHRDLKPSNLMVTREGTLKILDFGLARISGGEALTQTGASLGTPSYMAPEQVRDSNVDHRADLWSSGVVLFELLTGTRPFVGASMAATLYAIVHDEPPRLGSAPGAPTAGLQRILDRCLQKEPARRYDSATELAADLRAEASHLAGFEDVATMSVIAPRRAQRGVPRWRAPAGAVAALALLAWGGKAWLDAHPREALRVALAAVVLKDAVPGDSTEAALASANVQSTLLRELAGLRGVSALDGSELKGVEPTPVAVARALAAEEAIVATITARPDEWQVSLRRLRASDSTVVWAGDVTVARQPSLALSDALAARLVQGFPDHAPRVAARPAIGPEDYAEFLDLSRIFHTTHARGIAPGEYSGRLDRLLGRAPRFLDLSLLDVLFAQDQFETTREGAMLERATRAAERARQIAPDDPRPMLARVDLALLASDTTTARQWLDRLRAVAPGDADVEFREARLLEATGRSEAAQARLQALVRRRPARLYYERLARMEYQGGHYDRARAHLNLLLERYPDYLFPHSYLAQLELLYGSPVRAESLYATLVERYPRPVYLSNLALAQMLLGRYAPAIGNLERALQQNAGNAVVRLNLADCLHLSGDHARAAAIYRGILALEKGEADRDSPGGLLLRAQCLAHLGQSEPAVAAVQQALRTSGDDPDALFQSALVYCLAGERASALATARRALAAGLQPRWLGLPWFESLRDDPAFQSLLKAVPPAK
jgi:serine/threonine-protein kinase